MNDSLAFKSSRDEKGGNQEYYQHRPRIHNNQLKGHFRFRHYRTDILDRSRHSKSRNRYENEDKRRYRQDKGSEGGLCHNRATDYFKEKYNCDVRQLSSSRRSKFSFSTSEDEDNFSDNYRRKDDSRNRSRSKSRDRCRRKVRETEKYDSSTDRPSHSRWNEKYSDYRRPNVTECTSENVIIETLTIPSVDLSNSPFDNVYRSGNLSTSVPKMSTTSEHLNFKIPEKVATEIEIAAHINENLTTDSTRMENESNVVQSAPSVSNQYLREQIETILKEIFNPDYLAQVMLDFIGKISENHVPSKVKEMLEKNIGKTEGNRNFENLPSSSDVSKTRRENSLIELGRLNEVLGTTFTGDTATGRQGSSDPATIPSTTAKNTQAKKGSSGNISFKRRRTETLLRRAPPILGSESPGTERKVKKSSVVGKSTIKNNNPEWHSLNKITRCQICGKGPGTSLVSHFVNVHPDNEVFSSRLDPAVADVLRNLGDKIKCEQVNEQNKNRRGQIVCKLKQFCFFCNAFKCVDTRNWIKHMAVHTGYYLYKCTNCSRKFSEYCSHHFCEKKYAVKIPQPQFEKENLMAYICDLCNFVRFTKTEIEKHLCCEHEGNVTNRFKKVMFLSLLKQKKKHDLVEEHTNELETAKHV